jgi:vacuolar-type H+-ATPase subunit E/Vma4
MIMSESHLLDTLVRIVVEDAEAACRRVEDKALNESRRVVLEAQVRVDELTQAARRLGQTRGRAAEAAEAQAAAREVDTVEAGAFDALFERFVRRVVMGLGALPSTAGYDAAIRSWARVAAPRLAAPAEVFTAKRDRRAVYEALLAAGAEDFHVRVDHRVHVGFVARDLEGRTLYDARPDALVTEHREALRVLLERAVPPPPSSSGTAAARRPAPASATE